MPRPKGSKNKKTPAKSTDLEKQIAQKAEAKAALEEEQKGLAAVIADSNAKLKAVKKNIKTLDKQILALQTKKAEIEAAAEVAAKQEEIQARITALTAKGKSLDDILDMLK